MQRLVRFFRGVVRVRVRGGSFGKLLTLLISGGFDIIKSSHGERAGELVLPARQYKRIRRLAKRSGCELRVIEKIGLPFIIKRDRYLITRLVSAAVFAFVLIFLASRVVIVEIVGVTGCTDAELKPFLAENGVHVGAPIDGVDQQTAATLLHLRFENLSWAAVNLYPYRATIELKEKTPIVENRHPQGAVFLSRYDATVSRIDLLFGTPAVAEGMPVFEGELLAYGGESRFETSPATGVTGRVFGIVSQNITYDLPTYVESFFPLELVRSYRYLELFGREIPLFLTRGTLPESYESRFGYIQPRLFGIALPVRITVEGIVRTAHVSTPVNEHNAEYFARRYFLEAFEREHSGAELLLLSVDVAQTEGGFTASATLVFECVISTPINP